MTVIAGVRYTGAIVGGRRLGGVGGVDPYSLFSDDFEGTPSDPEERGFSYYNPALIAGASVTSGVLRHLANGGGSSGSFWYNGAQGYLIYKTVGATQVQVRIRQQVTNAAGDGLPALGSGSTYRLVGFGAHNPNRSGGLNYVHMAAGVCAGAYAVETKSTLASVSTFPFVALPAVFPWTIDHMLQRDGDDWASFYRHEPTVALESDDDWVAHTTFNRPDLPTELQWGLMSYASVSTSDIGGMVEAMRFASL